MIKRLVNKFVESFPEQLEDGVLYVSMEYAAATHKCACGCGSEVVTPISPTDWRLSFDGKGITLDPSIGNWSFPCRSHYFIVGSTIQWAESMSQRAIELGRARNRQAKAKYYGTENEITSRRTDAVQIDLPPGANKGLVSKIMGWIFGN